MEHCGPGMSSGNEVVPLGVWIFACGEQDVSFKCVSVQKHCVCVHNKCVFVSSLIKPVASEGIIKITEGTVGNVSFFCMSTRCSRSDKLPPPN